MKTALLSHIVIDEVLELDSTALRTAIGGAGAYAAIGASLVSSERAACLVSGVGRNDLAGMTAWCADRGIDSRGLFVADEHSPRTLIVYHQGEERTETPRYGIEHFDALTPYPSNIPSPTDAFAGVYLFHAHEARYWDAIVEFRRSYRGTVLWEIAADSCLPEFLADVRERCASVDVLSINLSEARSLLGQDDPAMLIDTLGRMAPTVLLRMGSSGSLVRHEKQIHHVGVSDGTPVDFTGGGNSFSGAFLAAFVEDGNATEAARLAAAAAAATIETHGAPRVDGSARVDVRARSRLISVEPR